MISSSGVTRKGCGCPQFLLRLGPVNTQNQEEMGSGAGTWEDVLMEPSGVLQTDAAAGLEARERPLPAASRIAPVGQLSRLTLNLFLKTSTDAETSVRVMTLRG